MQGMRYFISLLCWLASASMWSQNPHWQLTLSTGATSSVGDQNASYSAGTFLTSASARFDVSSNLRAEAGLHSGGFGLTSSAYNRYEERLTGGQLGLIWHPNWSRDWRINPYMLVGACTFQHTLFADLHDAAGQPYHLWSDGALYDMAEDAPYAQLYAQSVLPDFLPDAEVATRQTWGMPVRIGIDWQVSDQWTLEAANAWYLGVEPVLNALDAASSSLLTAFTVGLGWRPGSRMFQDERIPDEYLSAHTDTDGDGVRDAKDDCYNTPTGVAVDSNGCPTDEDGDGVPDYRDAQLGSTGLVDATGVEINFDEPAPRMLTPHSLDYRQVIAEPETGNRPHLPIRLKNTNSLGPQPVENP